MDIKKQTNIYKGSLPLVEAIKKAMKEFKITNDVNTQLDILVMKYKSQTAEEIESDVKHIANMMVDDLYRQIKYYTRPEDLEEAEVFFEINRGQLVGMRIVLVKNMLKKLEEN